MITKHQRISFSSIMILIRSEFFIDHRFLILITIVLEVNSLFYFMTYQAFYFRFKPWELIVFLFSLSIAHVISFKRLFNRLSTDWSTKLIQWMMMKINLYHLHTRSVSLFDSYFIYSLFQPSLALLLTY